jgi:hypothetical protein
MDELFEESVETGQAEGTETGQPEGTQANAPSTAQSQAETQQVDGNQSDSFTSIDPAKLPAELQPFYRQMQSDYTKKTMGIAEVRKQAEQTQAINQVINTARQIAGTDPKNAVNFLAQQLGIPINQAAQFVAPASKPVEPHPFEGDEYAMMIYDTALAAAAKVAEAKAAEKYQPFQERIELENRNSLIAQVDTKFGEAQKFIPDVGRDAFENSLAEMALYPQHAEYAAIHAAGGLSSFVQKVQQQAILNYQNEIKTKNNVSKTLTSPGPQVIQKTDDDFDFDNPNARAEAYAIIQASKAQREGGG